MAALLEAAGAVFAERGYDTATMTEIAARGGSAIGSLYQFFPTKELLADALITQYTAALYERLAALEEEAAVLGTDDLGTRLFGLLIDFRADHPAFATLAEAGGKLSARAAEVRQRLRRQIAAILRRKAPLLPESAAAAMAVVVQQIMKAAVTLNAEPALPARKTMLDELRALLLLYLRARLDAD